MSDLSRPDEALFWCVDWLNVSGSAGLLQQLKRAEDHLRNVDVCERRGRWPSEWDPDQVRLAARFLHGVADTLREGADLTRSDLEALYLRARLGDR